MNADAAATRDSDLQHAQLRVDQAREAADAAARFRQDAYTDAEQAVVNVAAAAQPESRAPSLLRRAAAHKAAVARARAELSASAAVLAHKYAMAAAAAAETGHESGPAECARSHAAAARSAAAAAACYADKADMAVRTRRSVEFP